MKWLALLPSENYRLDFGWWDKHFDDLLRQGRSLVTLLCEPSYDTAPVALDGRTRKVRWTSSVGSLWASRHRGPAIPSPDLNQSTITQYNSGPHRDTTGLTGSPHRCRADDYLERRFKASFRLSRGGLDRRHDAGLQGLGQGAGRAFQTASVIRPVRWFRLGRPAWAGSPAPSRPAVACTHRPAGPTDPR